MSNDHCVPSKTPLSLGYLARHSQTLMSSRILRNSRHCVGVGVLATVFAMPFRDSVQVRVPSRSSTKYDVPVKPPMEALNRIGTGDDSAAEIIEVVKTAKNTAQQNL